MPSSTAVLAEDETGMRLFPPLRSGWALRGKSPFVPISGYNAKRIIFGAININTGYRTWMVRKQQYAEDFMLFLDRIRFLYRRWPIFLLVDEHSTHTTPEVRKHAFDLNIHMEYLPKRSPKLNPMDHLWRDGKKEISANIQYRTIGEHVNRFLLYLSNLSNYQALLKAGLLSDTFWLNFKMCK